MSIEFKKKKHDQQKTAEKFAESPKVKKRANSRTRKHYYDILGLDPILE